ncbi:MAG: hypothetical protein PHQ23_02725 [Candidatus Wallbacteria bacterium]|nr:hypothetical protein [Candidatus Wallbacteria bacterium]
MPGEMERTLLKLPARPVQFIVETIYDMRQRFTSGEDVEVPLTTLYMKNGHSVTGRVLDLTTEKKQQSLLFHVTGPDPRNPLLDVLYIDLSSVEGIVVHNAGSVAHVLSFGNVVLQPGKEPPTKADLKRRAEKYSQEISSLYGVKITYSLVWEDITDEQEALLAVGELMGRTTAALSDVALNPILREEIGRVLRAVFFTDGDAFGVSKQDFTMTIRGGFGKRGSGLVTRDAMRKAISELFD